MAPHAPVLRFGLQIPSLSYRDVPDDKLFEHVSSLATAAERSGFDSHFVMDHFYQIRILERHCEEIGRDPGEITKTALGSLVIAPDEATAGEQVRALAAARTVSEEQVRSVVVAGAPASVVEQVTERLDAGLDGIVFNLPASPEPETVELAGSTLAALVA